jgi:hypothetical protein
MEAKVWVCDGCSSWTDRPVTLDALLKEWGWVLADDGPAPGPDGEGVFCPECL